MLGETFEICFKNIRATAALLWELGFSIYLEKSVLVPTQQNFLWLRIDSVKITISQITIHLHALPEYLLKLSRNNQSTSTNHRSDSVLIQSCSIQPNVLQGIGKMQSTVPD